jgi:dTDP-4-amino-4,6-dideoxygalactose transaminase
MNTQNTKPDAIEIPSDGNATGHVFDHSNLTLLHEVLESGVLNVTRGSIAKALESRLAERIGCTHVHSCNSGSAAVHAAIAALDFEPGTEIVTTPLTDFGGIGPILWQGCIPVFADIDPHTLIVTRETIEAALSDRTGAVIVTHLFGNAAEIDDILALARDRGLPVIEDCAQALETRVDGRHVGVDGNLACFSMQQTKHLSTGEGGFVVSNDAALASRVHQFMNKARNYDDPWPDHHFLAMNFRMTEMQAAIALPQLDQLERSIALRRSSAELLTERLSLLKGITPIRPSDSVEHAYWRYACHVDPDEIPGGNAALGQALKERGLASAPGYQRAAMDWTVMRERKTFGSSGYPFTLARPEAVDYNRERWPGLRVGQKTVLVLPWTNRHTPMQASAIADAIESAIGTLIRARTTRTQRN